MKTYCLIFVLFIGLSACTAKPHEQRPVSGSPSAPGPSPAATGEAPSNNDQDNLPTPAAKHPEDAVRVVAIQFFAAAVDRNVAALERMTEPGKSPARQAARGREQFMGLGVAQVVVRDDRALVVSTALVVENPPGPEQGAVLLTFKHTPGVGWRCVDIDFEKTNDIPGEVTRFQKR